MYSKRMVDMTSLRAFSRVRYLQRRRTSWINFICVLVYIAVAWSLFLHARAYFTSDGIKKGKELGDVIAGSSDDYSSHGGPSLNGQDTEPEYTVTKAMSVYERVEVIQKQRQETLKTVCLKYNSSLPSVKKPGLSRLLSDKNHHVVYANLAKVGSTTWVNRMIHLVCGVPLNDTDFYLWKFTDHQWMKSHGLTYMNDMQRDVANYRLENYKSFMFVRHPFVRLVSAFRDRLGDPGKEYYKQGIGRTIISMVRANATKHSLKTGDDVTFPEFVKYLLKTNRYDIHWRQYYRDAHPCQIRYDFIGKMETLREDTYYVLTKIFGLTTISNLLGKVYDTSTSIAVTREYFKDIPEEDILGLIEKYRMDFLLFDYTMAVP